MYNFLEHVIDISKYSIFLIFYFIFLTLRIFIRFSAFPIIDNTAKHQICLKYFHCPFQTYFS